MCRVPARARAWLCAQFAPCFTDAGESAVPRHIVAGQAGGCSLDLRGEDLHVCAQLQDQFGRAFDTEGELSAQGAGGSPTHCGDVDSLYGSLRWKQFTHRSSRNRFKESP
ncbi:hypothetical protein GCM10023335_74970 [Streptomyces siamensis]|uniref:Uncharacterized protein n=1 Tax=Streptomyces siamensis TaxID=1274986 RepID=A0ABP9JI75_9ACTN